MGSYCCVNEHEKSISQIQQASVLNTQNQLKQSENSIINNQENSDKESEYCRNKQKFENNADQQKDSSQDMYFAIDNQNLTNTKDQDYSQKHQTSNNSYRLIHQINQEQNEDTKLDQLPPNQCEDKMSFDTQKQKSSQSNSQFKKQDSSDAISIKISCPFKTYQDCPRDDRQWIFAGCKHNVLLSGDGLIFCKEKEKDCRDCYIQQIKFCCRKVEYDRNAFLNEIRIFLNSQQQISKQQQGLFYYTLCNSVLDQGNQSQNYLLGLPQDNLIIEVSLIYL